MDTSFAAFLAVSAIVIATPGPDTALTIRNVVAGGRGAGIATAFGVAAGQIVWAAATSLGLVALLLASEALFNALRLAGAAYLVYLGIQSLRAAFARETAAQTGSTNGLGSRLARSKAFGQGLVNDLANPKMAVFFASVLPQFAQPGQGMFSQLLLLGAVFAALTFLWLSLYSVTLSLAGRWLRRSGLRRTIDAALIGFGVRVATSER